MAQWVYKATRVRATRADAHGLAVADHFLCRSAFAHGSASDGSREVGLVGDVAIDDVIHYYFRTPEGTVQALGSFRVVDGSAFPDAFEPCVGHGALVQVRETQGNRKMLGRLKRGYSRDPKLAVFTGWALEKLPKASGTPGFDQGRMFPSLTKKLWRYPDPSLPCPTPAPACSNGEQHGG
jgi:hypothetical protein